MLIFYIHTLLLQISPFLEVAVVQKTEHASQYPGVYLYTTAGRMMRPVFNLKHGAVEYIGMWLCWNIKCDWLIAWCVQYFKILTTCTWDKTWSCNLTYAACLCNVVDMAYDNNSIVSSQLRVNNTYFFHFLSVLPKIYPALSILMCLLVTEQPDVESW